MHILRLLQQDNDSTPVFIIADQIISFGPDGDGSLILMAQGRGLSYFVTTPPDKILEILSPDTYSNPEGAGGSWG